MSLGAKKANDSTWIQSLELPKLPTIIESNSFNVWGRPTTAAVYLINDA